MQSKHHPFIQIAAFCSMFFLVQCVQGQSSATWKMPWPTGFQALDVELNEEEVDGYISKRFILASGNFSLGAPVSDYWQYSDQNPASLSMYIRFDPQIKCSWYLYPRSTFGFTDNTEKNDTLITQYLNKIAQDASPDDQSNLVFKKTEQGEVCIFPSIEENDRQLYMDQAIRSTGDTDLIGHQFYESRYTKSLEKETVQGAIIFIHLAQSRVLGLHIEAESSRFNNYFGILKDYLNLFYVAQHGSSEKLIVNEPAMDAKTDINSVSKGS